MHAQLVIAEFIGGPQLCFDQALRLRLIHSSRGSPTQILYERSFGGQSVLLVDRSSMRGPKQGTSSRPECIPSASITRGVDVQHEMRPASRPAPGCHATPKNALLKEGASSGLRQLPSAFTWRTALP